MIYSISGEQPFQVNSDSFSVSPSESGYDLYLSADGVNYSNFATVAANTTRQFTSMNNGNYYILSGNTSEVKVNWDRECHGGGGGGGTAGVSSLDGQTGALTLKTVNNNSLLGSGNIEISGGSEIKSYVLDDLSQSEVIALYSEIYELCSGNTLSFPAQNYKFYSKLQDNKFTGLLEVQLAGFEGDSYFEFVGVAGDKNYVRDLLQRKFRITSDGNTSSQTNTLEQATMGANNFSWLGRIYYDADNSQFLRGETVLDPSGNTDSFCSSTSADNIIENGIWRDDNIQTRFLVPTFGIYIVSGATTHLYTCPQIIGVDISSITIDGQDYNRKYSFVYTREDGGRFIVKMCLNSSNYATGFEFMLLT